MIERELKRRHSIARAIVIFITVSTVLLLSALGCGDNSGSPETANSHFKQTTYFYNLLEYEEAIQEFDKAIELNPVYAEAYFSRGLVYFDQDKYQRGIKDFSKAIHIDPDYGVAYVMRAGAYRELGQDRKARADLKLACEADSLYC